MALTNAQKQAAFRKRLKEAGGEHFTVVLSPEQAQAAKLLTDKLMPELQGDNIVKALAIMTVNRLGIVIQEKMKLIDAGASQSIIDGYVENELTRMKPLTAKQYLAILKEKGLTND